MKKVFLLSPPYVKDYMRNARCDFVSNSGTQWYPIWLGMCGALLEREGYEVRFVDAPAAGLGFDQVEALFSAFAPDLLVMYTGKLSEDSDVAFADRLLAGWSCAAVFVGPFFSIAPEAVLAKSSQVRLGVYGEFEHALLELLGGADPRSIGNMLVRDGENVARNPPRPYLTGEELDALPMVSDFFSRNLDWRHYRTPSELYPFTDIMTGRGCVWGQCIYCLWVSSFIKGRRYNVRSLENVMEELEFIERKTPHMRSVMLQDDTFPAERAAAFAEMKMRRGIRLPWSCYARGDIDYDTLAAMKRSGCRNLHVGFESGSPEVLRTIRKGLTRERMTRFAEDARRAGVRIHGDFAIGFPGESRESVQDTVDWACSIRPHTAQFQIMIPFPGTPFWDMLQAEGWLKGQVPDYPDLSWEEMEALAKQAYRRFYLSLPYALEVLRHPVDQGGRKLRTYARAIPSIFWRKWNVR
jgi:anaerobic magnesium-protoporphyrin IX monomethyl ester cyclase